jgi:hypothetical protein
MTKHKPEDDIYSIDPDRLPEEWVRQPDLYIEAALELADANHKVVEAKIAFDITNAEVEYLIRDDPGAYDINKPTEGAIRNALMVNKKVQTARKLYNQAVHHAEICSAQVKRLEHRKKALENLVYLNGQMEFAEPREGKNDKYRERINKTKKQLIRDKTRLPDDND